MSQKIVVVTGAGGGLGREFVKQYIDKGYLVIGIDINDEMLNYQYDNLIKIACDLTNSKQSVRIVDQIVADYGTPDIWINNAGIVTMDSFFKESQKRFQKVMKVNFDVPMRMMKKLIPIFERNNSGTIVNVSSVAGLISAPILSSYCASKFALVGLTESVQQELDLRGSPVKLILVCPGFIQTDLIRIGEERGFPEHLRPFLSSSDKAVHRIIKGIEKGHRFIDPTANGKILQAVNRFGPGFLNGFKKYALPKSLIDRIKS